MTEAMQPCCFCGMPCAANEYHPYAACLMFKACQNAETVRANLAEVRKQDDALILQLVEALEVATTPLAKDRQEVLAAITAARARLEGKP